MKKSSKINGKRLIVAILLPHTLAFIVHIIRELYDNFLWSFKKSCDFPSNIEFDYLGLQAAQCIEPDIKHKISDFASNLPGFLFSIIALIILILINYLIISFIIFALSKKNVEEVKKSQKINPSIFRVIAGIIITLYAICFIVGILVLFELLHPYIY